MSGIAGICRRQVIELATALQSASGILPPRVDRADTALRDLLMHVAPSDLRTLRQNGTVVQFALLGSMAYVIAELPVTGSRGTPMEDACEKPHWGFLLDGELIVEVDGQRQIVPPGSAFHVPSGGSPHRLRMEGRGRIAGFEPIDPIADISDGALAARGFEILGNEARSIATVIEPSEALPLPEKQIETRTWPMSSLVLTQARFGPGSGYTADWCDASHWGLVTAGRIAIEWEDDVEILSAGDVFYCPLGPPGHRIEAADAATFIDLTPADVLRAGRLAPWRKVSSAAVASGDHPPIAVAALR
jgi:quercetin dioxygenase-like cupin family protein